jgi:transcription antitermination factor NusG
MMMVDTARDCAHAFNNSPDTVRDQECGRLPEWHVIATEWQAETLAAVSCREAGFQTFRPLIRKRDMATPLRPARITLTDAFPGYLFVLWHASEPWGRVKSARGVAAILHATGDRERPAVVRAAVMDALLSRASLLGIIEDISAPDILPALAANTPVRIRRGHLTGHLALCEWSTEERVGLLFDILGVSARVIQRRDQVEEVK